MYANLTKKGLIVQGFLEIDRTRWGVNYGSGKLFEWLGDHLVNDAIHFCFNIVLKK